MPPRSASVQRRAERVSVSRDAKRARAAQPPSCFQAPLCRRWRSRARDGPASDRQGAQAKAPKAPSPGPDRRADEGRESGSACSQSGAVEREAERAPGAAVPQARRDRCAAQRWLPEVRPKADAAAQRERPATRGAGFCLARREAGAGGAAAVLFPGAALSALAKPRSGRPGKRPAGSAGEGAEGAEPRAGPASGRRPRERQRPFPGGRREARSGASAKRRRSASATRSVRSAAVVARRGRRPMPPRSASVLRRAERVSVSRDAKRARAAQPPSCFQAPLCRRWQSRARDGPASDREEAQAKGPKASSPGPDRHAAEGRESGSARFQAAAVKRKAERAPGAAVPQARSVQRGAEPFPWLFLRPASARLAGPARMRGKPRPKGGAASRLQA